MNSFTSPSLGDAALDQDHERLHELIDALLQASEGDAVSALNELRSHAEQHFTAEDVDLREMGGGNASCHLDEHAAVLKSLDEVHQVLVADDVDAGGKATLVRRLGEHLLAWLPHHVQEMDAGVVKHRATTRLGGMPVRMVRRTYAGSREQAPESKPGSDEAITDLTVDSAKQRW